MWRLGGSLDVPTTILGLLGRPYESMFFGRDLLAGQPEGDRALLNHNRDIGLLVKKNMVVLGLMKTVEFYQGEPKAAEMKLVPHPTDADKQLQQDAIALYQVADDLYMHRRYRIDAVPGQVPVTGAVQASR